MFHLLLEAIIGLIVGALAKFLMPGKDPRGHHHHHVARHATENVPPSCASRSTQVIASLQSPACRWNWSHLFLCTAPGAPGADKLVQFGLSEGSPNQHPGQGTACRRFPFANAMIELLWVSNAEEAQSQATKRTSLWERWSGRGHQTSPFGICLRPSDAEDSDALFPSWNYRPAYLEEPFFMSIGEAGVEEPMWVYLSFMRRTYREQHFLGHPIGIREITGLMLTTPVMLRSEASRKVVESGILATRMGTKSVLELEFDGGRRNQQIDFQPDLPLIFRT